MMAKITLMIRGEVLVGLPRTGRFDSFTRPTQKKGNKMKLRYLTIVDRYGRKDDPVLQFWSDNHIRWMDVPSVECKEDKVDICETNMEEGYVY